MHRVSEGNTEAKTLHVLGAFDALVLIVQGDGLPVDVFHGGHEVGNALRARSQSDSEGHWA